MLHKMYTLAAQGNILFIALSTPNCATSETILLWSYTISPLSFPLENYGKIIPMILILPLLFLLLRKFMEESYTIDDSDPPSLLSPLWEDHAMIWAKFLPSIFQKKNLGLSPENKLITKSNKIISGSCQHSRHEPLTLTPYFGLNHRTLALVLNTNKEGHLSWTYV